MPLTRPTALLAPPVGVGGTPEPEAVPEAPPGDWVASAPVEDSVAEPEAPAPEERVRPPARAEDSAPGVWVTTTGLPPALVLVMTVGAAGLSEAVGGGPPEPPPAALLPEPGAGAGAAAEDLAAGGAAPPVDRETWQLVEWTMVHMLRE